MLRMEWNHPKSGTVKIRKQEILLSVLSWDSLCEVGILRCISIKNETI